MVKIATEVAIAPKISGTFYSIKAVVRTTEFWERCPVATPLVNSVEVDQQNFLLQGKTNLKQSKTI